MQGYFSLISVMEGYKTDYPVCVPQHPWDKQGIRPSQQVLPDQPDLLWPDDPPRGWGKGCACVPLGFSKAFDTAPHTFFLEKLAAHDCTRGCSGWKWGKISSLKGWLSMGIGCTGNWWSHHCWNYSRNYWVWHLVGMVVFGPRLDSVALEVFSNPNDLWYIMSGNIIESSRKEIII